MTLESSSNVGQSGDILERAVQPIRQASNEASAALRDEASHLLSCASERIRKNPVPVVAGAVAFGIAIGYLFASGRHTPTFQERYMSEPLDQATDAISTTFGRLFDNLKFW